MIVNGNMEGFYPMEGNADDASSWNNDGTVVGTKFVDKVNQGVLKFYGVLGVNFGNVFNSYIVGSDKKFAFSFWMNPLISHNGHLFTKYGSAPARQFTLALTDNGRLSFGWVSNESTFDDYAYIATLVEDALDTDRWYHVVVNVDMTQAQVIDRVNFIVNGMEMDKEITATDGNPTYIKSHNADFIFGIRDVNSTYPFQGVACDLSFWSDNLTLSETQAIYNSGKGSFYASGVAPYNNGNLVAYWGFWNNTDRADDQVGSVDGTVSASMFITPEFGKCAVSDGETNYIVLNGFVGTGGDPFYFDTGTSISLFIDMTNMDGLEYFLGDAANDRGIRYNPSDHTFLCINPSATFGDYTLLEYEMPDRTAHLVLVRTTNRNVDWYVDGVYIGSSDPGSSTSLRLTRIGNRSSANPFYFKGTIDNVGFFNYELNINDIKRLMLNLHPLRNS